MLTCPKKECSNPGMRCPEKSQGSEKPTLAVCMSNAVRKGGVTVWGTCPSGFPQRASLLRVEMVHRASPRPVWTTLCTSRPRPFGHILGPPSNSFPETRLPGGKETGEGTRALLSVEGILFCVGSNSDGRRHWSWGTRLGPACLTSLGVLRKLNVRTCQHPGWDLILS